MAFIVPHRRPNNRQEGESNESQEMGFEKAEVVLTYRQGNTPPADIMLGWQRQRLMAFVPEPKRCFRCQKFGGHMKNQCRSPHEICPVCAGEHNYEDCPSKDSRKCANCSGAHSVSYKKCPAYIEVKKIFTMRAETGESFQDCKKKLKASATGPNQVQVITREPTAVTITTPPNTYATALMPNNTTNTTTTTTTTTTGQQTETNTHNVDNVTAESVAEQNNSDKSEHTNTNNITKFLLLAIQLILATVQDKDLAKTLSDSINKSAEDLLGFSLTDKTTSTNQS